MCFLFFSFLFLRLPLSLFSLLPFCFLLFAPNVILQSKQRKNLFIHLKKKKTSNPEGEREREGGLDFAWIFFFLSKPRPPLLSIFPCRRRCRRRRRHCRSRDPPHLLRADQGRVVSRSLSFCSLREPHGEDDDGGAGGGGGRSGSCSGSGGRRRRRRRSSGGGGGGCLGGGSERPRAKERGDVRPGLRGVRYDHGGTSSSVSPPSSPERSVRLAGGPAARGEQSRGEGGEGAAAAAKDELLLLLPSLSSSSLSSSSPPLQPVLDKGPPAARMPPLERRGDLEQARGVLPRVEGQRGSRGGRGRERGVVPGQVSPLFRLVSSAASFSSCCCDQRVERRLEQEEGPEQPRGAGAGQGGDAGAETVREDVRRRRKV